MSNLGPAVDFANQIGSQLGDDATSAYGTYRATLQQRHDYFANQALQAAHAQDWEKATSYAAQAHAIAGKLYGDTTPGLSPGSVAAAGTPSQVAMPDVNQPAFPQYSANPNPANLGKSPMNGAPALPGLGLSPIPPAGMSATLGQSLGGQPPAPVPSTQSLSSATGQALAPPLAGANVPDQPTTAMQTPATPDWGNLNPQQTRMIEGAAGLAPHIAFRPWGSTTVDENTGQPLDKDTSRTDVGMAKVKGTADKDTADNAAKLEREKYGWGQKMTLAQTQIAAKQDAQQFASDAANSRLVMTLANKAQAAKDPASHLALIERIVQSRVGKPGLTDIDGSQNQAQKNALRDQLMQQFPIPTAPAAGGSSNGQTPFVPGN